MAEAQLQIKVVTQGLPGVNQLTGSVNKLNQAAQKAQGTIPKASNNIRQFGRASASAATGVKGLGAAIGTALAPLLALSTAAAAAGKAVNTAFERSAAEQKLRNFTDSTEEFKVAMALAAQASQKFGLSQTEALSSLADMNSRLRGLGFGLKEVSEIQQGFQSIVVQSGTSAEDAAGAFLQLSQALGSGRLQGDELRSILERMPTLAQRIADSMGVSTGEIRKLGSEGKLTSDIIQKALAEAANSSDGLGNKLTEQQLAMKGFGQAADQAFAIVGEALGPVLVKLTEAATWAIQELTQWWEYLAANVFPQVQAAIAPLQEAFANAFNGEDLQFVINLVQNGLKIALDGATAALANMSKILAFVINGFKALSDNPVFKFIAEQVGRLADMLGLTGDKVGEFKDEQTKANDEIAKGVKKYSQMPPKIEDAKEAQKQLNAALKEADEIAKRNLSTLDQEMTLNAARIDAEKAINDVLTEQARRRLDGAESAAEQMKAAEDIYKLTIQQAELEYKATLQAIDGMVRKAQLAQEAANVKLQEVQAAKALAAAQGQSTALYEKAIAAQRQALAAATQMLKTTEQVAGEQRRAAEAQFKGAKATAAAAFEQNKVWEATQGAANEAGRFAQNMQAGAAAAQQAATAAQQAGSAAGGGGGGITGSSFTLDGAVVKAMGGKVWGEYSKEAWALQGELNKAKKALRDQRLSTSKFSEAVELASIGQIRAAALVSAYAKSLSSSPGAATAGGQRVTEAMNEYRRQSNPNLTPQVSITTGPVTQMDGTNYVTTQDLQNASASAAQQGANLALSQLQNNPQVRRAVGVAQ